MRPGDCHNCEYAPVLVLEHCVMETLVEPYDDANVSITWAGREASPRTAPAAECLWVHRRMFLSADGESGKRFGNETIRVDHTGHLSVKVPGALVGKLGARLSLAVPVEFHHRQQVWADRVAANRCVAYRISFDPGRGRWYLQASWAAAKPEHVPTLVQLATSGPVLG